MKKETLKNLIKLEISRDQTKEELTEQVLKLIDLYEEDRESDLMETIRNVTRNTYGPPINMFGDKVKPFDKFTRIGKDFGEPFKVMMEENREASVGKEITDKDIDEQVSKLYERINKQREKKKPEIFIGNVDDDQRS